MRCVDTYKDMDSPVFCFLLDCREFVLMFEKNPDDVDVLFSVILRYCRNLKWCVFLVGHERVSE